MAIDSSFSVTEDLESDLMALWVKFLKKPDLTVDDDFFESGGDSLLATEMLFEIEDLVGKPIPPSIVFETGTVRQAVERLAGELTPKLSVRVGEGRGRLFHFFHGDFNNGGVSVRRLSTMLGSDRPILAIAPHGMDGAPLPATIEEMAAERLPVILEAQPKGPYVLGGHCNGALVAFETARLLVEAGHRVDLIVMIDPVSVYSWRFVQPPLQKLRSALRLGRTSTDENDSLYRVWLELARCESAFRAGRLPYHWKDYWRNRRKELRRRLGLEAKKKSSKKVSAAGKAPVRRRRRDSDDPVKSGRTRTYHRVMSGYHPAPLDVPMLYFALGYSGREWRGISPNMETVDSPKRHIPIASDWQLVRSRLDALDQDGIH